MIQTEYKKISLCAAPTEVGREKRSASPLIFYDVFTNTLYKVINMSSTFHSPSYQPEDQTLAKILRVKQNLQTVEEGTHISI